MVYLSNFIPYILFKMAMLNFTDTERAVLSVCQLQGGAQLGYLSEQAGLSPRVTKRTLEKLEQRGVLTPYVLINHFAQGLIEAGIYLTPGSAAADFDRRLTHFIDGHPAIAGVTELGGSFSLCFDLLVTEIAAVSEFLEEFTAATGAAVLTKGIVIRTSRTVYQRKFFGIRPRTGVRSVTLSRPKEIAAIDSTDRRILEICTKFPRCSRRDLARRAKLPQSTFEYRLKLLENAGVFMGFAYAFRSLAAAAPTFRILAEVRKPSAKGARLFESFCKEHRNTVTLNHSIGAWDHEIRAEFESEPHVNEFRNQLLSEFQEYLASVHVISFLGTRKLSSFSP